MATDGNEDSFLKSRAFRECAAVFIAVGLLGMIILAMVSRPQSGRKMSKRISCVNILKQLGLGLRMYAGENEDKFPTQISIQQDGSKEWVGSASVYRHFMAASNEIGSPKALICPSDSKRSPAINFGSFRNQNLSYLIELSAKEDMPSTLLTSDRNMGSNGIAFPNGCYLVATQQVLGWGPDLHGGAGNVGLTDGSVQQLSVANLNKMRLNQQIATNWLAIP